MNHGFKISRWSFRGRVIIRQLAMLVLSWSIASSARAQTETVLHSFTSAEAMNAQSDLFRTGSGNLFGTAAAGGDLTCSLGSGLGCGTVYKFVSSTSQLSVLHNFEGSDGLNPLAGFVFDSKSGTLYGTTFRGGTCTECGVVFKVGQNGQGFEVLHYFSGTPGDGANPQANLFRDAQGNLFGTTLNGGLSNQGTVFEVDATGHETILYNFKGGTDGANPQSALVEDSHGNFYGSTASGGANNCGTLYELSPPRWLA